MMVLTAVGRDRPGIAARVTRVLFEAGCNIEDASMTILCGEFTILLMLSAPAGLDAAALDARFETVRRELDLYVALRDISGEAREGAHDARPAYLVSVSGFDKPGIVSRVTQTIAEAGINVTDLESKAIQSGPSRVYMLMLEIEVPEVVDMDAVSAKLNALGTEIGVQVRVSPVDSAPL